MAQALGERQHGIVVVHRAEVNADRFPAQRLRHHERVFEQFPRQFERQSLAGVHRAGLARRYVEEVGVELRDIADWPGDLEPVTDHAPELPGVGGGGEPTGEADDRYVCRLHAILYITEVWCQGRGSSSRRAKSWLSVAVAMSSSNVSSG